MQRPEPGTFTYPIMLHSTRMPRKRWVQRGGFWRAALKNHEQRRLGNTRRGSLVKAASASRCLGQGWGVVARIVRHGWLDFGCGSGGGDGWW